MDAGSDGSVNIPVTPRRDIVRFEGVSKRFGDHYAVEQVDLAVREGEFFALLGPSGCGKTTLMRLLAGFETPDAGRILLDGQDIAGLPPHRRPVTMMFQSYALFPHLTVAKNIAYGLRALPRQEAAARVDEMLALVKLDGMGDRKPHQLSGGQQQRVALARALAPRPRILLLDEPLAALDRKLREETQAELVALQRRLGLTFVVVTHDQDEALAMADRLAVMQAGRIAQVATPREVYERPATRAVAEFLGEVNVLPDGDGWIAVRPETVVLGAAGLPGRIGETAYFGDRTRYVVETAQGRIRASRANVAGETPLAVGAEVAVSWPPGAATPLAE
ncbi:ABC transporter ATP-binding protein [Phenylobacterium sp. J426]|uniref:ABC transporter ATP-binding protein n=1 Tax=Phenylobacterium sp. J426 TaxID=2898439 RepID=UPI0021511102|nr:ABC transporter ATP-binding protein [Phenylobacterium sp. J426]MCR5875332.1 ABC transporter ATP-binding protein [Phenylobacterium sp. J426]